MSKIKINLISGTVLEKPLVTAFKGTNGDYVVFDNEMSGTMGLPIILISKLEGNGLVKIADKSAEWDSVKELLRQIIAGSQANYINVPASVSAPDDFFTQLTLPVNSFELLKNKYSEMSNAPVIPEVTVQEIAAMPVAPAAPFQNVIKNPVVPEAPAMPVTTEIPVQEIVSAPVAPAAPTLESTPVQETVSLTATPAPETPTIAATEISTDHIAAPTPAPVAPTLESTPVQETVSLTANSAPATPTIAATEVPTDHIEAPTPAPVAQAVAAPTTPVDYSADKEAFLKACENMFDALIAKFNK